MRICFLAEASSIHTARWVGYFVARGDDVSVISRSPGRQGAFPPGSVHVLAPRRGPGWARLVQQTIEARAMLRRLRPDLLNAHYVSTYGVMAALSGFGPIVVTAWGSDILISPKKSSVHRRTIGFALRRASITTCDGEHMLPALDALGLARQALRIIYFGTDTQRFSPAHRDALVWEKFGWPASTPVVISIRNLAPIYDLATLVRAASAIVRGVPETRILIGGDGEERGKLEALARSLGVHDRLHFCGSLDQPTLATLLASAAVYVSTSLSDGGIAASTAEAMSSGLPAVVTDFGDNRRWVTNGINGFTVPARSPDILADRVLQLLRDGSLRTAAGKASREMIVTHNEYGAQMAKVERVFKDLIEGHNA